ncbi:MAG: hypothetical protein LUB61_03660 [Eggerthellaceae bacterium]|nr:hypothetical protein [Eggerthellaceae bacterium]
MLGDKIEHYKEAGEMLYAPPSQYKDEYPFLKIGDSLALCNVQYDLQDAYLRFFKDPQHFHFPKFKSKKYSRCSYTTNSQKGTVAIGPNYVLLPKVKKIKAKIHRHSPKRYKLKSATVSRETNGSWYASVLYEYEEETKPTPKDEAAKDAIGLDYKSNGLFVTDTGVCAEMPKFFLSRKSASPVRKEKHPERKGTKKVRHPPITSKRLKSA